MTMIPAVRIHGSPRPTIAAATAVLVAVLVAACGGGGSGSGDPSADPPSLPAAADRLPYWASDTGLRPDMSHLLRPSTTGGSIISLDAAEAAQVLHARSTGQPSGSANGDGRKRALAFATQRRTVTGLSSLIYRTAGGSVQVYDDLTFASIEAIAPDGVGGYEHIPATSQRSDGTYVISGVPEGPHWVRMWNNYVWTDAGFVDWSFGITGRADTEFASVPTLLSLNASNLSPWQPDDVLTWSVPQQGTSGALSLASPLVTNPPQPSDTALTNFTLDMGFSSDLRGLLDASKGDQAYINQLVTQPATGLRVLARSLVLPSLTTPAGSSTSVVSGFLDIPPTASLTLRWDRGAYMAHATSVNPSAVLSSSGMDMSVFEQPPVYGTPDSAFTLLEFNEPGGNDIDFGRVAYGNPFPADWHRLLDDFVYFSVRYQAPGTATPAVFERGMASTQLLDGTTPEPAVRLAPRTTPPRNPKINGKSLFTNQLAVGLSPTITWSPPELGTANHYFVRLAELVADGQQSKIFGRGFFYTPSTTLTVPPGLMEAGHLYFFTVAAISSDSPVTQPMHRALPVSFGTLMSAIVSP